MQIPLIDENGKLVLIELDDMECIVKDEKSRKLRIGIGHNFYYVPSTLDQISCILCPLGFFKIDKNKIVNLAKIDEYKNGSITIGDRSFCVSRRNRTALKLEIDKHR